MVGNESMRYVKLVAAVAALAGVLGQVPLAAEAATVTRFNKSTNDGVYTLSDAQAAHLGQPSAGYIGFFRVRGSRGTRFDPGDTFDAASVLNSFTGGRGNVLAVLNGDNRRLTYTGGFLDPLGTTVLSTPNSYYRGAAILFAAGTINFNGGNFNGSQSRGAFADLAVPEPAPAPVPLPHAAGLLLAGLGGLALLRRRAPAARRA
jgi:hypothetical protein